MNNRWIDTPAARALWDDLDNQSLYTHRLDQAETLLKFEFALLDMTQKDIESEIERLTRLHDNLNEYGTLWWKILHRTNEDEVPL